MPARKQRVAVWLSVGLIVFGGLLALGIRWIKTAPPEAIADTPIETPVAKIRKVMKRKITPPVAAFKDIAAEAGISWTQVNGANGNMYFPESMGTGVAWVDWDNDLDPDLLFVNHTHWPEDEGQVPPGFLAAYENDGKGNFKDVTEALGLKLSLYGTGIATGDGEREAEVEAARRGETVREVTGLGRAPVLRQSDADADSSSSRRASAAAVATAAAYSSFERSRPRRPSSFAPLYWLAYVTSCDAFHGGPVHVYGCTHTPPFIPPSLGTAVACAWSVFCGLIGIH